MKLHAWYVLLSNDDRVKLGVDLRTGEHVAVKIMYRDNMTPRAMQQLRREITSMKALEHPNILRLKDVHEVSRCISEAPVFGSFSNAADDAY